MSASVLNNKYQLLLQMLRQNRLSSFVVNIQFEVDTLVHDNNVLQTTSEIQCLVLSEK